MDFKSSYGPWALVTGAAQGLGKDFARELAGRGLHLFLTDKQDKKLADTARTLQDEFSVQVRHLAGDLSQPDCLRTLCAAAQEIEIGLLVNNAATSIIRAFHDAPLEDHLHIVDVNVRAPLTLAHCIGKSMRTRRRGGIIFISSASAIAGTAYVGSYAGSKAYGWILAEALWAELAPYGVDVLSVVAGDMDTPAWRAITPRPDDPVWPPVMPPQAAAREALSYLGKRPVCIVPGWQNRLVFFLMQRLMPRTMAIRMLEKAMRQRYDSVIHPD